MRVCFYTLGCKVNLNETGALEQMFRGAGFTIVPEGEEADVFVVNSCTVTNFGDQKSRKWLRRAKRENPGAVTVLTGCYPQAFPEEAAQFMEADLVCGNGDRKAILDNVLKLLDGHERIVAIAPHAKGERFEELPVDPSRKPSRPHRGCAVARNPRTRRHLPTVRAYGWDGRCNPPARPQGCRLSLWGCRKRSARTLSANPQTACTPFRHCCSHG